MWKCAITTTGALCATTDGEWLMLLWSAENWDFLQMVSHFVFHALVRVHEQPIAYSIIHMYLYMYINYTCTYMIIDACYVHEPVMLDACL